MNDRCTAIGFIKIYQFESDVGIEEQKIFVECEELKRGFKIERWYKPNKQGIKAKLISCSLGEITRRSIELEQKAIKLIS